MSADPTLSEKGVHNDPSGFWSELREMCIRDRHVPMFCKQLFDLAMLSNKPLNPEEMTAFINRSNEIMMFLAK